MADGKFWDVTVYLPVTVRLWAEDEEDARRKYARVPLRVTAPVGESSICVGWPESMAVSAVETGLRVIKE